MFRSLLKAAVVTAASSKTRTPSNPIIPPATTFASRLFSSKAPASKSKAKAKAKPKKEKASKMDVAAGSSSASAADDEFNFDDLPPDPYAISYTEDKSLDVGPKGQPLFTSAKSISDLGRKDICSYMDFKLEELNEFLPEGLPMGMTKEFDETKRVALLVRQSFLDLRDNFRRIVDPPLGADSKASKVKKQIVLDGLVSCGKSITLAMLVHWARSEGWLVFYVPRGKEWSHGGFFYKQPETSLWDTPVQAAKILQDFLKYNQARLQGLPVQIYDPILLGEGAGVGWMKGVDSMAMPEGSTLFDLIQTGLTYTHAAVGVVVHLRKELSLVKEIPVLFAIDQFNSWFTFSEYEEPVTMHSCRPIHARELSTVNAFRSMLHNDMMVGAFSHSTAVGKLRKDLPDVPLDARVNLSRYTLDEAATVSHYYLRQKLIRRDAFSEERWKKIYYLSNGNGTEMRWLAPFV
ncbi:hypothetical protein H6P81_017015 [Aristolochia fimbriata]|uniref:Small ribosomal subunit protein mS29 n=1 Tax=Aristolochia fimbriata TaxID=158543 RepID=A0AAV7DZY3_ARIFI|nr:hypothetical protein H6P81_017015 [Aristolochia fimbriata]